MTASEDCALRIRETMVVLAENASIDSPMRRSDVWNFVESRFPLDAEDAELNQSGKMRGLANWSWATADLTNAGWLKKSGDGLWHATPEGHRALDDFADAEEFLREARVRNSAWTKARKETQRKLLSTVIVPADSDEERVRDAAMMFVRQGLQANGSVFAPGRQVWTKAATEELIQFFVDAPEVPGENFVEKLKAQLSSVSEDARLLMAELVTWQLLPIYIGTIGAEAKRMRVEAVLSTMEHPVQIPVSVVKAFETGVFNPGPRMSSNLFAALSILVCLVDSWFALSEDEREQTLADPWAWRDFVRDVPGEKFPTQRNSINYLVLPEYFGPMVSETHKGQIRDTFIGEIEAPADDLEQDLHRITVALQVKENGPVGFYDDRFRDRWQPRAPTAVSPHPAEGWEADDDIDEPLSGRRPFRAATPDLSDSLLMDETWLQSSLDLIERRNQIILYGPPGTGKTYLARELAKHIAGGADTTALVQFHPSYSYEDFFEGYRPSTVEGALTYELRPGPMKRIAERARANKELNYVLIIDEINRGNLAKIFGELYFLLEYRDESVSLLYGQGEKFTLPSNVFIIGTMNTSDRSIALMDAAMRRRFAFIELHPNQLPTSDVLPRWLRKNGLSDEPALLLDALNSRITDSSFQVGPSYLMDRQLDLSERRLNDIWSYEILPLLEEHHFGEGVDVVQRYGLPALRRALARAAAVSEDAAVPGGAPLLEAINA